MHIMTREQRLATARKVLPFVADFCGRQNCGGIMPDYDLWTLKKDLAPDLVAG